MEFRLLGPLEVVEHDRRSRSVASSSARCSRCCCCTRTRSSRADRLIDELWGEAPPATAAKSVQVYVSRLRKELGERPARHAARPATSCTSTRPSSTSPLRAARRPRRGGRSRAARRRSCAQALALWRGPPLADLAYEPFAQTEIARLEELRWRGARAADRRRPRGRPPRRARRRAGGARRRASAARAAARPADARALPLGPPGRGARRLPGGPARARRGARARAGRGAASGSSRRSCGRTPRSSAADRRRRRARRPAPTPDRSLLVVPRSARRPRSRCSARGAAGGRGSRRAS